MDLRSCSPKGQVSPPQVVPKLWGLLHTQQSCEARSHSHRSHRNEEYKCPETAQGLACSRAELSQCTVQAGGH